MPSQLVHRRYIAMRFHETLRSISPLVKILPVFGFTCGLMGAVSYLCTDMLSLRLFTIANGGIACVFYFLQPKPIWVSIFWNFVFFAINIVQVAMLLAAKGRTFTEKEMDLYRHFSHTMSVQQWGMLLSCGNGFKKAAPGEVILQQGETSTRIVIISSGCVRFIKGDCELNAVGPGTICGEISVITDSPEYGATVKAEGPCEFVEITHDGLKKLDYFDADVKEATSKLLSTALAQKFIHLADAQEELTDQAENRMYADMLRAVVAGGGISDSTRALLKEIRQKHNISDEQHVKAVKEIGRTQDLSFWSDVIEDLGELHRRLLKLFQLQG